MRAYACIYFIFELGKANKLSNFKKYFQFSATFYSLHQDGMMQCFFCLLHDGRMSNIGNEPKKMLVVYHMA